MPGNAPVRANRYDTDMSELPEASDIDRPAEDEHRLRNAVRLTTGRELAVEQAASEIEKLRGFRQWRGKDVSITALVSAQQRQAASVHRRLGELIELWTEHVPPNIAAHTTLTTMRGGVLHVAAESSAVRFEADRLLRGGLLAELRRHYRGTLSTVKITVAATK